MLGRWIWSGTAVHLMLRLKGYVTDPTCDTVMVQPHINVWVFMKHERLQRAFCNASSGRMCCQERSFMYDHPALIGSMAA